MKAQSGRPRARQGGRARVLLATAAAIAAVTLVGCGSSKPAYCADRANLENSVKGLTSVNVISSGGITALKSQLATIENDATALANSAKTDFPTQTSAISSSVDALKASVAALASQPSATRIAVVAKDVSTLVNSVKSLTDATSSQCG